MSKERFLSELREYLSILEDQEQEDILAEYAQHIDMKMLKGLSEEEAIRDFGSVKELAAEILAEGNTVYYTGHCTGDWAYARLHEVLGERLRPMDCGASAEL